MYFLCIYLKNIDYIHIVDYMYDNVSQAGCSFHDDLKIQ